MRWRIVLSAALAGMVAAPACAQIGPHRHFTQRPLDTNRNEKIVYVPLALSYTGERPGQQPHDVAAASWHLLPIGSADARPDRVLDDATYRVERFDVTRDAEKPQMRVVISRRPAPPEGMEAPRLEVVHPETRISARAMATVDTIPDGVRYTFMVTPPMFGFAPGGDVRNLPAASRFELRLQPAREVKVPRHITRLPTFGGADPETQQALPAPRLPVEERVAGRRQEVRGRDRR